MISQLQWRVVGKAVGGALLGVALGAVGCSDTFSGNCASTRSCSVPDPDEAGEGGSMTTAAGGAPSGGGGSGGVDSEPAGGAAGDPAGGASSGPCQTGAECSNGDATDGNELCVAGVCRAGNAPPAVVSITPAAGSDDVERDATVTVVFSEPLDPATISAETVELFVGDSAVAGTLQLSAARDQVSFAPDSPLDLWATYRVEVSRTIKDAAGASMLHDESFSFQVRDGVWSVATLADAGSIELPNVLPVSSSGALLATWLATNGNQCVAQGAWILEGKAAPSQAFESARTSDCTHVSASIAPNGNAMASWAAGNSVWTQSFANGSWAAGERQAPGYGGVTLVNTQGFAHDEQHISIVLDVNAKGAPVRQFLGGAAVGEWSQKNQYNISQLGSRAQAAFGKDGSGLSAWTHADGVFALRYDAPAASWESKATVLPGTEGSSATRSVPNLAISPAGDALVLWFEGPTNNQVLKSSRFAPTGGWQSLPVNVSSSLGGQPLFDAPGLVFDGETFVSAWTAATGGKLTTYTARYDMSSGKWSSREPHVTDRGESAVLMPRLGVDAHRNLMLIWAAGAEELTVVYQRYHAETESWGDVQAIPDSTFTDAAFNTDGKLTSGFAGNGLGGLMFRTERAGSQRLRLASFF